MTTPYTYIIKHKPSGKVYYGCRYAKVCTPDDLWSTYFTSSKQVKKLIKETGKESFDIEIRKTFNTVDACRNWENRVLKRLNVNNRQHIFLNKTDNISISVEVASAGAKSKKGMKYNWSEEGLNNIKKANSQPRSDEFKQKVRLASNPGVKRGPRVTKDSPQGRENKRLGHLGKSSGMKGKSQCECSCILCGHVTKYPNLKSHYKYKHNQ